MDVWRSRSVPFLVAIVAALAAASVAPAAAADSGFGTVARSASTPAPYIVVFRDGVADVNAAVTAFERTDGFVARFRYTSSIKGFAARLNDVQLARIKSDPRVAFVSEDRTVTITEQVPIVAGDVMPGGIRRIGAGTETTVEQASTVNVAVIDTGVDLTHPDLNAVHGKNCQSNTASANDDNGHGSHVAGRIAAKNNGAGILGVVPGTKIYAVKVLNSSGSGAWSEVICGIDWVTANTATLNIKVANMSLGGNGTNDESCGTITNDALHAAVCRSAAAGVTHVVAAGNSSMDLAGYTPASYPEVLTVTSMTDTDAIPGGLGPTASCRSGESDDRYASYSNWATRAEDIVHTISAPGTCTKSTWMNGGYNTISGTSMAAPHMAGVVALCFGTAGVTGPCAGLTPAQIVQKMRTDAQAHATTANGFSGDPLRPYSSRYYGYLGWAGDYAKDETAPAVSAVAAAAATDKATITWTTNEPADSTVEHCVDADPCVPLAPVSAASFVTAHSIALGALAPATTYRYTITSKDRSGNSTTVSGNTFTTAPLPSAAATVDGLSPATGASAGGTRVTITGSGFGTARSVAFGTAAATFTIDSDTQLTATTPAGAGAVMVTVTNEFVSSESTGAAVFTYVPAVTRLSTSGGSPAGGTAVTITGTGFTPDAVVKFGAAAAAATCSTATQCTATSPAGSGTVDVTVSVVGLTSATSAATKFSYDSTAPAVSNVQHSNVTSTGARITWTTNEASTSVVEYWTGAAQTKTVVALVTSHVVDLTGLSRNSWYSYRVRSVDAAGNISAWSSTYRFKTRN